MRIAVLFLATILVGSAEGTTCSEAIKRCIAAGSGKNITEGCNQAGAACMKSGSFTGPVSGTRWDNLVRR